MNRIQKVLTICIIMTFFLTGCGIPTLEMVELSEMQAKQVTEYAAGLLLKDATNYNTRLVDTDAILLELAQERERQEELDAKIEAIKAAEAKSEENESVAQDGNAAQTAEVVSTSSIEDVMEMTTTTVVYTGYELLDSYPEGDDIYMFSMDATEGQKLLVVHFDMTNIASEESVVDTTLNGCRYRCSINGGSYQSFLSTLLLNDLSFYKGNLAAGESQDVVLITEVPSDTVIDSLQLLVKKGSEQVKIALE